MYAVMRVDWAAATVQRSIKLRYYVTTAARKVSVNWLIIISEWRLAHFSPIS